MRVGKVERYKGKYVVNVKEKIKGKILGVRQIQDRGRVQIPKVVREKLHLREGDNVYWIEGTEYIYLIKAVELG